MNEGKRYVIRYVPDHLPRTVSKEDERYVGEYLDECTVSKDDAIRNVVRGIRRRLAWLSQETDIAWDMEYGEFVFRDYHGTMIDETGDH